jgi:hypothetical protein
VSHCAGWRCPMPVFDARRNPNDVSLAYHLNRATPLLNPADTISHDQYLAERMGVPGRSRSRLERNLAAARPGWFLRVKESLNTNRAREGDTSRKGILCTFRTLGAASRPSSSLTLIRTLFSGWVVRHIRPGKAVHRQGFRTCPETKVFRTMPQSSDRALFRS